MQVVGNLSLHPELRRGPERHGQEPSEVRRDVPVAVNDAVEVGRRVADVVGQLGLADPIALEEVALQQHPGVGWSAGRG